MPNTIHSKPAPRQVSNGTAVVMLVGAIAAGVLIAPPAVAEWRSPGTFAESIGAAPTEIPAGTPAIETLLWMQGEAEAVLAGLPGGSGITVYAKTDVSGPCGTAFAAACASTGGSTIWLSNSAPSVREVVVHEYLHLKTNPVENIWLRLNGGRVFGNAAVPPGGVIGLEGIADCGVQMLVPGWAARVTLPYVTGACTDYQLRLAAAVLDDKPLWEVTP